jgi:opacity protein-like surface antigen
MKKSLLSAVLFSLFMSFSVNAQVDEDQTGAWYMYFWNTNFGESEWGLQGDIQYRNWDLGGDLEQLLIRGGLTYSPKNTDIKFTLGYGNITSGEFGEANETSGENRIYQEALLPHKLSNRFYLTHRFRYEQRWVENQDFRTRYRYNLFLNVPLNQPNLNKNAVYLALYNEIFINGEREIGDGRSVELFDRNRFYSALGYALKDNLKLQAGYMTQITNTVSKGQIQLSLHHTF